MQISSRFTIAIHIFLCIDAFQDTYKITSDFLADSVNVNPVIIRKILQQLKKADLISVVRGSGGATTTKPLAEITLLDVYQAVELVENGELFHIHEHPNAKCPVGKNIHLVLKPQLNKVQQAMERELSSVTLEEMRGGIS